MKKIETGNLPQKGVLFLGGNQNLVKKLRQLFPKWTFIYGNTTRRYSTMNHTIVFYCTEHSSHEMMNYAYKKLPNDVDIVYVTATNLALLIGEMENAYNNIKEKQRYATVQ